MEVIMWCKKVLLLATVVALPVSGAARPREGAAPCPLGQATAGESAPKTPEVSTEEVVRALDAHSATVLDVRPFDEFAMSHIPGALNVSAKPGVPISMYVSDVNEIQRILNGNKAASLIVYCNGPHCGKSKRLAEELLAAGFTNVRRYQAGIPVWRAVGEVTQIEAGAAKRVLDLDKTAVLIDTRNPDVLTDGAVPGAKSVPRALVTGQKDTGEIRKAKDDGRLPMEDHNTRIVVFGGSAADARYVAEAIAREAFHNVSFFAGRPSELK
jgi:rhodanese-related sulfurtransferase